MSRVQLTATQAAKRIGITSSRVKDLAEKLCIQPSGLKKSSRVPVHKYWYSDIMKIKKYDAEIRKKHQIKFKNGSVWQIGGDK